MLWPLLLGVALVEVGRVFCARAPARRRSTHGASSRCQADLLLVKQVAGRVSGFRGRSTDARPGARTNQLRLEFNLPKETRLFSKDSDPNPRCSVDVVAQAAGQQVRPTTIASFFCARTPRPPARHAPKVRRRLVHWRRRQCGAARARGAPRPVASEHHCRSVRSIDRRRSGSRSR